MRAALTVRYLDAPRIPRRSSAAPRRGYVDPRQPRIRL